MAFIKPEVGDFFPMGLDTIYVIDVEEKGGSYDRATTITGHDNDGNEVEVTALMLTAEEYDEEYGTTYADEDEDERSPWPYKHQDI